MVREPLRRFLALLALLRRFLRACGTGRRDADEALEVVGELALVVEPGPCCDLGQGGVGLFSQEVLRPLDSLSELVS